MVQLGFAQTRKHRRVQNSCSSARAAAGAVVMNVGDPVFGDGHVYTVCTGRAALELYTGDLGALTLYTPGKSEPCGDHRVSGPELTVYL